MQQGPDRSWIQHALEQAPWRSQQRATSLVMAFVVIVAVVGALYLAQASRTATTGRRLQELEAQRQTLEQQNAQLRAEVAALRSVPRLIAEAERLGFHVASAEEVEYLELEGAPPTAETGLEPPAPRAAEEDEVPEYEETLESWLTAQLAAFREQFQQFIKNTFGKEKETSPDA